MSSDQERDLAAPRGRRTATAERTTRHRLDTVPAPRPAPELDAVPPTTRRGRRGLAGAVAAVAVVALAGTGLAVDQAHHRHVEAATRAEADRVSASHAAAGADVRLAAYAGANGALHDRAVTAARAAVTHADATLAAAPHADGTLRDALSVAESRLNGLLGGSDPLTTDLTAVAGDVQAADQRVADSEAAWQAAQAAAAAAQAAAEQAAAAQAAAAQAAADQAAAAQAAAARAAAARPKTVAKPATRPATRTTTTSAPPASSSTGTLPAGALQCTAAGSGASAASASALGAAINSYRSSHSLPTLSVVTSGALTNHALDMANAGGIWHSGSDNIVGCVSNGSYSYLVQAWDGSAPHRAQMQRTGISTMSIGVATRGGWLYGAVYFS